MNRPLHHNPRFLKGLSSNQKPSATHTAMPSLPSSACTSTNKRNDPTKPWLILKFGGTSLGKFLENITSVIINNLLDSHRVAVVCSARSTDCKAHGTTNRLLRAATEALAPGSKEYLAVVDLIIQDHVDSARSFISDPDILAATEEHIRHDCQTLKNFLSAAEIIDEISPRSRDMVIAVGEKLSCRLVSAVLRDRRIDAEYVSLERIVDRVFDEKNIDQTFYDYLSERMAAKVGACGFNVPVVTGYFGCVPGSLLATVGRGYTDLAAALIAVGLQAEELQVWKEVDGIFTADPRKVPRARLLPIITPDEAAELTYYGSEVIHPFTMEQVIRAQIPIRIKNVQRPEGRGTIIFPDVSSRRMADVDGACDSPTPSSNGSASSLSSSLDLDARRLRRRASETKLAPNLRKVLTECGYDADLSRRQPTAVTVKDCVIVLNIHSNRKSVSHGFLANIFSTLDRHGIFIDLISTSEVHVSMVLGLGDAGASGLEKVLIDLRKLGTVDVRKDLAILSLVGKHMKNTVGISGQMFTTLANAGINIEMISQGASEINISCVIETAQAVNALNAIHDSLLVTGKAAHVARSAVTADNEEEVAEEEEEEAGTGYWRGLAIEDSTKAS